MSSISVTSTSQAHVPDETQASVDALADLENYFSTVNTSGMSDTKFHDQENTNLCHSYSLMSGFRHILRQLLKNKNQQNAIEMMKEDRDCSFYRFLAVFLGCINPRSFDELFKVNAFK